MRPVEARGEGGEGSTLRAELRPARLIPSVTAGVVLGVMEVVFATSFAALIFTGELAGRLSDGVGMALITAVLILSSVALFSSLPGAVGSAQDVTAAIMALSAAAIAGRLASPDATFLTVVAAITVTTLATGGFFLLIGGLGLGNLVRFVPYPVIGGFLAGTGWLLVKGGIGVASGVAVSIGTLDELGTSDALVRWLPAVGLAIVMLLITRRFRHALVVPGVVVGAIVAFYLGLVATGTSLAAAEDAGLLLGPFPSGGLFRWWTAEALRSADWGEIVRELPNLLTVPLLAVVTLLLNTSGIELATRRDVDLNRELRAAGGANVLAAAGGGLVGFHALSLTALADRAGARSRAVGVVASGVCLVALLAGAAFLSLFPRAVLAGLILFLGLSFVVEWVIDARRSVPKGEYALVLLILAAIAALGFLVGVALGLAVALIMFVVQYSRTEVVKHSLSGTSYRSRVDRDAGARERLRTEGNGIHILELQGFVFFGTANSLLERIRTQTTGDAPVRWLVLDFRRVSGVDSSAVMSFVRAQQLAEAEGFTLLVSGIRPRVRVQLERGGFDPERDPEGTAAVREFPDLDRAMQWCEDRVLERTSGSEGEAPERTAVLRSMLGDEIDLARLAPYLDLVDVAAGEVLIEQGDRSDELYLLTTGRVTAMLARGDGEPLRLRTMGPGTVVGEVALYLGGRRTASVISDEQSRLYRLSREAMQRMDRADPDLAAALHRAFARLLSERLTDSLRSLEALLD